MAGGVSKTKHILTRIELFKDWYKLVFPFNRFVSKRQILHLRKGISLQVEDIFSSDLSVVMEVFAQNAYQLDRLALPVDATIVDVGANIGAFSLAANLHFPGAHIIAFEPSPRNFALLEKNVPFAILEQKAVSEKSGKLFLEEGSTHTALRITDAGTPVEVLSLDEALTGLSRIDLLKLDIEGSEYAVLRGASPHTLAKIQNILMEIHDLSKKEWYEEYLRTYGFDYEWIVPALVRAHRKESPASNTSSV